MGHGVSVWSSPEWRQEAIVWIDERLEASGRSRIGEVTEVRVRPWGLVLRAPTEDGPVWFKAPAPGTAFEVGLYELLARVVPEHVLAPLGAATDRAWLLLPDGGDSIGVRLEGARLAEAMTSGLVAYAHLQRHLEPFVAEMLELGVSDMRPAAMPERFTEALDAVRTVGPIGEFSDPGLIDRVARMEPRFAEWCEQLGASPLLPSLDHNDLHPWNMLGGGSSPIRFFDWGDSVVAHPFAAMLVPLGMFERGMAGDGPGALERARDAYLEVFTDLAPRSELEETLAIACRVAKVARSLTWERALRAAREQSDEVRSDWAIGPVENLAALLEPGWVGGG